jgi:hypothetical protein
MLTFAITEELSEEDQKLKEDLEMLVDRLLVSFPLWSLFGLS